MLLADWLREDHPLGDQLPVMVSLCRGVTAGHRRVPARALAMDPQKITVAPGGDCHIPEGTTPSAYRAPESLAGVPASLQSDIYSLGTLLYQMLARRHPAGLEVPRSSHGADEPPRPVALRDVRPDVPRDLVDAIMACLEPDPEWRPKDLEYLLSVLGQVATEHPPAAPVPRPGAEPPAPSPAATLKAARRERAPARRSSPLTLGALAVTLLLVAAAGAYFARRTPPPLPAAGPTPLPAVAPSTVAEAPSPSPLPSERPVPSPRSAAPSPAVSLPVAVPSPVRSAPSPEAVPPTPRPLPSATPIPSPSLVAGPSRLATPEPLPSPPAEPAILTNLSPPSVKRPGNAIVDVRGSGLRADHVVRILRGREAVRGIQVLRQRFVNPALIQVALRLDETVVPGTYQLYLTTGGTNTNARALEITR